MDLLQGSGMTSNQGDDAQTDRLSSQVRAAKKKLEDLEAQLKEREDAAKERIAKQTPQPIFGNYSRMSLKPDPENENAYVKAYSSPIETQFPTRTNSLKCSHQELQLIKGLLEIRKKLESGQFSNVPMINSLLARIADLESRPSY